MSTITFDFRHRYERGERREAEQMAYQWDLGHLAEIYVPATAAYEIHYGFADAVETDDYAIESQSAAADGGYKLTAHIPNIYFERAGELKVYVVGAADNHIITTYEGYITILKRVKPEDYVDEDPENGAETILERARRFAKESEAWADGEIDGAPVESTEPQYHNNSKYYSGQASDSATAAAGSAGDASDSATAASGSATSASTNALKAEGYAIGKQNGTDVPSGSEYYQNNAKYWASVASAAISGVLGIIATVELDATDLAQGHKFGEYCIVGTTMYRFIKQVYEGDAIIAGTGTAQDNAVVTTVAKEFAQDTIVLNNCAVSATTGMIVDEIDNRITPQHVLSYIYWHDSSKITALTNLSTDDAGHVKIYGTASAATLVDITLQRANVIEDMSE